MVREMVFLMIWQWIRKSYPRIRDAYRQSAVFIRQALGQGIRLDGRGPNEYREIEVSLSRAEMSSTATVVIGNTRVVSVLSGEIIAPYPDRPTEGDASLFADDFIAIYVWRYDSVPK
jgi:hypothetical protein